MPFRRSLSGRLLLLTALFVLIAEVLIFAPSIARYRLVWLQQRVDAGMLATLALDSAPGGRVTDRQAARLLEHAMVDAVVLRTADRSMFMLAAAMPPPVDATFDLRDAAPAALVADAFGTLLSGPDRTLRVLDDSRVARQEKLNCDKKNSILIRGVTRAAELRARKPATESLN